MKIIEMNVTPIAITDPPLLNAAGLHAPYALRTIVELVTNDNVSGLGEIPGSVATTAALETTREYIIGQDPFHLNAIKDILYKYIAEEDGDTRGDAPWDKRQFVHVNSAIEVACLDIMGKATGRPVVDLLGGPVRDRVPFSAYLFYKHKGAGGELGFGTDPHATGWAAARQSEAMTPESIVAQAKAMCGEFGFKSIKLKAGVLEPEIEVYTIFALRDAFGPDVPLRIDPNGVWSVETAIKWGQKMKDVLEYYEDPTRGQENMALVREAVGLPMATNMYTTSFADIPRSIELGAEDIILSDHHFWGGLRASQDLAAICRTFDRGLSMHSNSHIGISLAAMTHLAAAAPNLTYDLDTHYPWQSEDVITGGRMQFDDGSLAVPTTPGLGVELDRKALANLHENYKKCGLTHRNDEIEMQKVKPGWEFKPVRW